MTAVALIARPGLARDRLVSALRGIGMNLVLEADPAEVDDAQIAASGARALVVALDAGTEDLLDRFDASLADPNIIVLLEEADMVAARTGWDAARWSRHIAAKLGGHDRVHAPQQSPAMAPVSDTGANVEAATSMNGFDPVLEFPHFEIPDDPAAPTDDWDPFATEPASAEPAPPELFAAAQPPAAAVTPLSSFTGGGLKLVEDEDFDVSPRQDVAPGHSEPLAELESGAARLSLVEFEQDNAAPRPSQATAFSAPTIGAVLIEGGLGAPDALRRLLGGIPEGFPLPVLVRITLEGGRYDSLVKQMKRVATLPMKIARARDPMQAGIIYFLAPTISAEPRGDGLVFVEADPTRATAGLHAVLLAEDSAQLVLSGAGAELVDSAVEFADRGAWLAAQAPETCYDATVPNALILRGAPAAPAADLVGSLVERWPARRAQA